MNLHQPPLPVPEAVRKVMNYKKRRPGRTAMFEVCHAFEEDSRS